jgi:hypothetical protein
MRDMRAYIGSEIDRDHYLVDSKFQISWRFIDQVAIKTSKLVQLKAGPEDMPFRSARRQNLTLC